MSMTGDPNISRTRTRTRAHVDTAFIWEMRGILRNTQLRNTIKGLKINFKYRLQIQLAEYATSQIQSKNQTVMFDADYLLPNRIERNNNN